MKIFGCEEPLFSGDNDASSGGTAEGSTPTTFEGEFSVVKIVLEHVNKEKLSFFNKKTYGGEITSPIGVSTGGAGDCQITKSRSDNIISLD